ncbi:LysR substrate-binding domain-containing protein [Hydromonas duriensis]|uniref:LysR family glycine cleavage system transcriptional activator n=1 Tax=Hydromonas duriensis TaxID=1527608 RepID=A0A4R6Y8W8_9BURK|nr:LysR substrate-binding domain-containing protein [Hydromonas duriensis]TDR31874.1 LysR family glycine cleavage system transcriptional activator [Hydromonas duriensis]
MFSLPPLTALRAFESVARLGSVTRAAEELHVTHSAISHQVRLLEKHLGIALIDRRARRMDLTHDGRVYAYQIRQSLQQIGGITERITQRKQSEYLTIGVIPSFATHWLVPRLPLFWQEYPDWKIELIASLDMQDFEDSSIDCLIRFGEVRMQGLHTEKIMSDWQLLVARDNYDRYTATQNTADALSLGTAILANEDLANWSVTANLENISVSETLVVNDSNLAMEALRNGAVDCILTRLSIVALWIEQGWLKKVTPHMPLHRSNYHLLWPNRSHNSPKLNIFKNWLKNQCNEFEQKVLSEALFTQRDNSQNFSFLKTNKLDLPLSLK